MAASITVPRMYSDVEGECRFDSYDTRGLMRSSHCWRRSRAGSDDAL